MASPIQYLAFKLRKKDYFSDIQWLLFYIENALEQDLLEEFGNYANFNFSNIRNWYFNYIGEEVDFISFCRNKLRLHVSEKAECLIISNVKVSFIDLQDIQNEFSKIFPLDKQKFQKIWNLKLLGTSYLGIANMSMFS